MSMSPMSFSKDGSNDESGTSSSPPTVETDGGGFDLFVDEPPMATDESQDAAAVTRPLMAEPPPPADPPVAAPPPPSATHDSETLETQPGISYHAARDRVIREFEMEYLMWLVNRTEGNLAAAARIAGVNRTTLYRMMVRNGLERAPSIGWLTEVERTTT